MFYFINYDNPSDSHSYDKGELFEKLCTKIIKNIGYKDIQLREKKNGLEYDIVAKSKTTGKKLVGEAKAHDRKMSKECLNFIGKMYSSYWIKDPEVYGVFISISDITANVKSQVDEVVNEKNSFKYIVGEEIIKLLSQEANYCTFEQIKESVKTISDFDPGDTSILISDRGDFFIQLLTPKEQTLPKYFAMFKPYGSLVQDMEFLNKTKEKIDELKELKPYINNESNHTINSSIEDKDSSFLGVDCGKGWFEYQFPAPPDKFIGRKSIISDIISAIDQTKKEDVKMGVIEILGRSGVGKSSITLKLESELEKQGDVGIVIDSRNIRNEIDILNIYQILIKEINSIYNLNFEIPSNSKMIYESIEKINQFLINKNKVAVIFLDQFESIFSKPKIYNKLTDYIFEFHSYNYRLIFCVSRKNDQPTTYDESSNINLNRLKNSSNKFLLEDFKYEEAERLIKKMREELNQSIKNRLKEQILEISNGFPWLLKKFCAHIIKLVKNGKTQKSIVQSGMQLEDLFEEELESLDEVLRDFFDRLVYFLPATNFELTEVFDDPDLYYKLKALQNDYRLIRLTGRTYDTYNDILKEYVKTGKVSLTKRYILRRYPKAVINFFKDTIENEWNTVDKAVASQKTKMKRGNILNILREARNVDLITGQSDNFMPTESAEKAFEESNIPKYLNGVLKKNGIVKKILEEVRNGEILSLEEIKELLQAEMPFIEAKSTTWEFYARVLCKWLNKTRLLNYRNNKLLMLDSSKTPNYYIENNFYLPSIYMQQIEDGVEFLFEAKTSKSISEIANSMGRKKLDGFGKDVLFLNVVDRIARGEYVLNDNGEKFYKMEMDERKDYISNKLSRLKYVNNLISNIKDSNNLQEVFNDMLAKNNWKKSTTNWKRKVLKNWLKYCDLIEGNIKGREKNKFQQKKLF